MRPTLGDFQRFLAFSLVALACAALPASAQTPPAIKLDAGGGVFMIIDSTGNVITYGPGCGAAPPNTTCNPGTILVPLDGLQLVASPTNVILGQFTINASVVGEGRAYYASVHAGTTGLDIGVNGLSTGATGGTLTVSFTDTDYSVSGLMELATQTSYSTGASGSTTYTGYLDTTNTPFGTGTLIGSIPNVTTNASRVFSVTGGTNVSLTAVSAITLGPNATYTDDFSLHATPTTGITITCSVTSTGRVGVPFDSGVPTATGGNGVYTWSIIGTLPPGLMLNTSTGEITGTPTAPGSFQIEVMDSTGLLSTNTCPFTIIAPATTLTTTSVSPGTTVPAGTPVTITVTETNSGFGALSNVSVTGTNSCSTFAPASVATLATGASAIFTCTFTPAATVLWTATGHGFDLLGNPVPTTGETTGGTITVTPPPIVVTCSVVGTTTGEVGASFTSTPPTVSGGTTPYVYSIVGGLANLPAGLSLNTSTGVVTGTPTAAGTFSIQVTDANGVTATTTCPYTIIGGPVVTCSTTGATTGEVGAAFTSTPPTVSGGTTPYTYAVVGTLPGGLTLNTSTGVVTGTPTGAGSFSIQVTDAKGVKAGTTCPYTITGGPVVTCSATGTTGEVGASFTSTPPTVTGGTTPYTYAVVGTLPGGLTLNSTTGVVTGTPTGTGSFSIQVTDAKGVVAGTTCPYTITGGPVVTCSVGGTTTGEVGASFTSTPPTVTGGTTPYTYAVVGTLPGGLTLNSTTGVVTGTPTGTGSFSIQVTDAKGVTATTTCPYTITGKPVVTCSVGGTTTGEVGASFTSTPPTVSGGTTPYVYSIVGGLANLPAGLSLNTSTGVVTGTPTAAGTFSIQVTDAKGVTATTTCPYTITGGPVVTCAVGGTTTGEVGAPFTSTPPTVSGGTAPYTYSLAPGSTLPAGLSLNTSTGVVTGTPTAAGTFSIQVTDAKGVTATTTCPYTITGRPVVTCSVGGTTTGEVGAPFTSTPPTVSGGTTPYVYSIVGGLANLPAGLSLNTSTGVVTGTPTAAGTFSIQVTDAKGVTATTTCLYTINPAPPSPCLLSQLGPAGAQNFSILGLKGAQIQLSSGPLKVYGNVGIGVNGFIHLSGGSTQPGILYADASATVQIDGGSSFSGGVVRQPFTAIDAGAVAFATTAATMTPTQTFSQIQNTTTIVGNGGQNVIAVTGNFHLSGGSNLTLSGGANDTFIINVYQGLQMDGGSNIVLSGVPPSQVLFNFIGNQQFQTSGNADTAGIFLGTNPSQQVQINGGVHNSVFIFASTNFSFQSNPQVNTIQCAGPAPLLSVTKTADSATVTPPGPAGFTVTISNTGSAAATGVTLSDPLPAGAGKDINWGIDTTTGNPTAFTITGAVGSQALALNSSGITLNAGSSLKVHITGLTSVSDAGGNTAGSASGLNLGTDANYIFIDTGSTQLQWNAYQLDGNVLFGQGLTVQLSGGNDGGLGAGYKVYEDPTTNISGSLQNSLTFVSVPTSQTAAAAATALSVSNYARGLTATQTFSTINNTLTINGNGGLNVIDVGSIQNATLTINGSANDYFVFNVSNQIQTNQVMSLSGGVSASHILWNLTGTGNVLQTSGGNVLVGTFLATNGGQFQFSELQLTGELINTGGNIQLVSGNHTLTQAGFMPPTGNLPNTATVSGTNVVSASATATITIN